MANYLGVTSMAARVSFSTRVGCHLVRLAPLLLLAILSERGRAQEKSIAPKVVVSTTQHFEDRIERIQFVSRLQDGRVANPDDVTTAVLGSEECYNRVILEPTHGRLRVESWGVGKWHGGHAPSLGYRQAISFDGKIQREWLVQKAGTAPPGLDWGGGFGFIDSESDFWSPKRVGKTVQNWYRPTGIHYFPPYVLGKKLSSLLGERISKKGRLTITENTEGMWTITTDDPELAIEGEDLKITYDPGRGVVTGVAWEYNAPGGGKQVGRKVVVGLTKTKNEIWVPKQISYINVVDKTISQWSYSEIRINEPVNDEVFQFTFPLDTIVTDNIDKKRYLVGKGVPDDEAAVLAYAHMHGLRLDEELPLKRTSRSHWLFGVTLVSLGLFIVAVAFRIIKMRRKRLASGMGLVFLALVGSPAHASAAELVGKDGKNEMQISQCGWNIAMLTLHCFGREAKWEHMVEAMPSAECGVRLGDIRLWLEANNLKCQPRKDVSLQSLEQGLPKNMIAIFPIRVGKGYNHYVAVINHPRKGLLFVDPPHHPPIPLKDVVDNPAVTPLDGLVLFVSNNPTDRQQATYFEVTPSFIDLGKMFVNRPDASQPYHQSVTVTNRADVPVLVSQVTSVCGCIRSEWQGGMVRPGEVRKVSFTIFKGAWGIGQHERGTTFVLADGSETTLFWKGDGIVDPEFLGVIVAPTCISIPLDERTARQGDITREIRINFENPKLPDPILLTDHKWIVPSFSRTTPDLGVITVTIKPHLVPPGHSVEGILFVSTKKEAGSTEVKILVNRERFCRFSPDIVRFSSLHEKKTVAIVPAPRSADRKVVLSRCEFVQVPSGLKATVLQRDPDRLVLICENDGIERGNHFLTVRVFGQDENTTDLSLLVQVSKKADWPDKQAAQAVENKHK